MATKEKTKEEKVSGKNKEEKKFVPKGRLKDYWEKYPEGLFVINNMRAVLR